MWTIYDKEGNEKISVGKVSYEGSFGGEQKVIVTVNSPDEIAWGIGDYLIYKGEKFSLKYLPSVKHQHKFNSRGDAYVYSDVVFHSFLEELNTCSFLDVTLGDNNVHYTYLPIFSFYCETIKDFTDRLQANLDRRFTGAEKWNIQVADNVAIKSQALSFNNVTCMSALSTMYDALGVHYIVEGRNIIFGETPIEIPYVFQFGKGNGLKSLEKANSNNNAIVTRAIAYGSTKNMPYRYYNKFYYAKTANTPYSIKYSETPLDYPWRPLFSESMYLPNLMPIVLTDGEYDELPKIENFYTEKADAVEEYGIREGVVYFDGTNDNEEIFPSIEGMTADNLRPSVSDLIASGDLDEIADADNPTDNGVLPENGELEESVFYVRLKDIGFNPKDYLSEDTIQISFKSGACAGRTFDVVDIEGERGQSANPFKVKLKRVVDDSISIAFPNTTFPIAIGDKYVILGIKMPRAYVNAASQKLIHARQEWLDLNSKEKPIFTPEIDGINAIRNAGISENLKEGRVLRFFDTIAGNAESVTISNLTIDEEDGLAPQYKVTLSEEKTLSLAERVTQAVSNMITTGTPVASNIQSIIKSFGANEFLSKKKADRTSYVLAFEGGLTTGIYKQGISGAKIDENGDAEFGDVIVRGTAKASHVVADRANDGAVLSSVGFDASAIGFGYGILKDGIDYRLAIDYLTVRKGMTVAELVIQEYKSVGGVLVLSACNGEVDYVNWDSESDNGNPIYIVTTKDWERKPQFDEGDIVRCSRWDNTTNELVYYIGSVWDKDNDILYIEILKGNGIPQVGDNLVQFGSTTDTSRQGLIIISTEEGKPNITLYDGLNSADVNMLDKMTARLGNLNGIVKDDKTLSGYGLWTNNLYLGSKAEEVFKELINIGGRNYALGTSTPFTNNISTTASDWQDMRMYFAKGLKAGDVVNVSFDWSAVGANSATINKIKLQLGYGTETSINIYRDGEELQLSAMTGKYNCQLVVPNGVTENTTIHVRLRVFSNSVTSITISHLMLQKGQGDWQPAPEDALNALAEYKEEISHEFEVTNQGLSSVQKSVTSLQTGGGRNLLLKTNQGTTNWSCITNSQTPPTISDADGGGVAFDYINGNTATSWEIYAFDIRPELIKQGHTYTLTVDVLEMSTSSGIVFYCQIANPDATGQLIPDTPADKPINTDETWTKLTFTFTATASGNKDGGQRVRLFVPQNKTGVLTYIEFRNLKLEEGNVATAYTAAPEDYADTVAEQAKETAIKQTMDKIELKAYATETYVDGTIEVATADIKIEAGKISQSVSDLKKGVDGQISGLESKIEQTASKISLKVKELGVSNLNYAYGTGKKVEITSLANINNQSVKLYDVTGLVGGDMVSVSFKIRIKDIIFDTLNDTRIARIYPQLSAEYGYYALGITITADTFKDIQIDDEGYLNAHVSSEGIVIPTTAPAQKDTVGYIYVRLDYIDSDVDDKGNDIGVIEISELKVEKGDECTAWTARTQDMDTALLDTGIDIESKVITATADKFQIKNNAGFVTASVDEQGRLVTSTVQCRNMESTTSDATKFITTINEYNNNGWITFYYPLDTENAIGNKAFEIGWDDVTSSMMRFYDKYGVMTWKAGSESNLISTLPTEEKTGEVITEAKLYRIPYTNKLAAGNAIKVSTMLPNNAGIWEKKVYRYTASATTLVGTSYYTDATCNTPVNSEEYFTDSGSPQFVIGSQGTPQSYKRSLFKIMNSQKSEVETIKWLANESLNDTFIPLPTSN